MDQADFQEVHIEENAMGTKVGVWIDHRKAIIVSVTDKGEETGLIVSKVQKQLRRSGDSPLKGPFEALLVPADDSRQRAFTGHLNIYYQAIIVSLRDAESILIFGPGEAKAELQERLKAGHLGDRIVGVETVDKMTDRQVAAKIRKRFTKSDLISKIPDHARRQGAGRRKRPASV
jgi:hypothetical protein